jgi:hypothetical protein
MNVEKFDPYAKAKRLHPSMWRPETDDAAEPVLAKVLPFERPER